MDVGTAELTDDFCGAHHRRNTGEPADRRRRCTRRRELLEWAAKELTMSRRGTELEFGDIQDWELHMGGGGLIVSHPASATIVVWTIWLGWLSGGISGGSRGSWRQPGSMKPEPAEEAGQGGEVEVA